VSCGWRRGFGFVVYESKTDAEEAISRMDNTELDGRMIRVRLRASCPLPNGLGYGSTLLNLE
jgi:nucleolin